MSVKFLKGKEAKVFDCAASAIGLNSTENLRKLTKYILVTKRPKLNEHLIEVRHTCEAMNINCLK